MHSANFILLPSLDLRIYNLLEEDAGHYFCIYQGNIAAVHILDVTKDEPLEVRHQYSILRKFSQYFDITVE